MITQEHINKDFTCKHVLQALGCESTTFHRMSYSLGITFPTKIYTSLVDLLYILVAVTLYLRALTKTAHMTNGDITPSLSIQCVQLFYEELCASKTELLFVAK